MIHDCSSETLKERSLLFTFPHCSSALLSTLHCCSSNPPPPPLPPSLPPPLPPSLSLPPQGTVKQRLPCGEQEGRPTTLTISGLFLAAGTDHGFVKLWDLSRRYVCTCTYSASAGVVNQLNWLEGNSSRFSASCGLYQKFTYTYLLRCQQLKMWHTRLLCVFLWHCGLKLAEVYTLEKIFSIFHTISYKKL